MVLAQPDRSVLPERHSEVDGIIGRNGELQINPGVYLISS